MRTATAIAKSAWSPLGVLCPQLLIRKFKKALLDYGDVPQRRALLSLIHAVAVGDIKIAYKPEENFEGRRMAPDTKSGVFEDARVLLIGHDGKVLNPTPFTNAFFD